MKRNAYAFEHVAEVFKRSHAVLDKEIFLFAVIHHAELVNGHPVKLEISGESADTFHNPGEPVADASAVPEGVRLEERSEPGERAERGVFRNEAEKPEMSMLAWSFAGKQSRNGCAGVAELHFKFAAFGKFFFEETVFLRNLPSESVDEQKNFNMFHFVILSSWQRSEAGK